MKKGTVYLVGAGPGDPGLLTLKGKRVLEKADVVVYDRLIGLQILAFAPSTAEKIYVGKASSAHSLPQGEINTLLAQKCSEGKIVVRLKGGDPFLFGRGGEEALYLSERGCAFEIVPGITSAIAAPACAGIPVTHRETASSVAFITGHEKPGKSASAIHWQELAKGVDTLVFLMGVENLPAITQNLIAAGKPAATPAALVRNGSLPGQEVLSATLGDIAQKACLHTIKPPAVLVIGEVVRLRDKLSWAEKLPLWGKRIVVTRPAKQSVNFIEELQSLGAAVLVFPTVEIQRETDLGRLHKALDEIDTYRWLIFTSRNGVEIFFEELFAKKLDTRCLHGLKICAIGPATAGCLRAYGIAADIVPEDFRAEGLVRALKEEIQSGDRVLLPRARASRDLLVGELRSWGACLDEIHLYEAVPPQQTDADFFQDLVRNPADLITFTSSSTVTHFAALAGPELLPGITSRIPAACIGPVTAQTARENGFTVTVEASEYTMAGLLNAILASKINA